MAKVMITIHAPGAPPTLDAVRSRYGLQPDDVDAEFGVVEIDPQAHDYAILVEQEAARRIVPSEGWDVSEPYANPPIAPFGPPEK